MDRRFIGGLVVFVAAVCLLYRDAVVGNSLNGWELATTTAAFTLLSAAGIEAIQQGTVIAQPGGFSYEIYYRCTGILPVATLWLLILIWKGTFRDKLLGLAIGTPALLGLNLLRLVHLFHVGVQTPQYFDFAHRFFWEGAMMGAVLILWMAWMSWIASKQGTVRSRGRSRCNESPSSLKSFRLSKGASA